jgi:hypothetical protein
MEEELWKPIENFENYEISTSGRVKNTTTDRIMKLNSKGGYLCISLINSSGKKIFKVHRLVALAFIPNPENKTDVNHIDKNKHNNNISNLEWNTRAENNIHSKLNVIITTNRNKSINRLDKKTNELLEKYNSIELAGEWVLSLGLTKTAHNGRNAIGNVINGVSKTAYGFRWELENTNQSLENEIWKQVIIENINNDKEYFVSNLGRFKNSSGIIMDNYKVNENGYIRVFIYNKTYALHRLIALAFLENSENKEQVNHIDGNKLNNCVNNLEWVTNQENQIHKFNIGLGNNYTRKITQYDLEMNKIKDFNSIVEASKTLNIGKSNIRGVLTNYRKTAGGFIFKYLERSN